MVKLRVSEKRIQLADASFIIRSSHSGVVSLPMTRVGHFHRSILVPELKDPLLSVSALCDDGFKVVFDKTGCSFFYNNDTVLVKPVGMGVRRRNLYIQGTFHPIKLSFRYTG